MSVFSISSSTAALRLGGGGSMFDRKGSHGSGAERTDDVHGGVELHDERAHTGQQ